MAMFEKMSQLIAVFGVDNYFKAVGCFLLRFYSPAFGIGSSALWCIGGNVCFDILTCFSYSCLYILTCQVRILL